MFASLTQRTQFPGASYDEARITTGSLVCDHLSMKPAAQHQKAVSLPCGQTYIGTISFTGSASRLGAKVCRCSRHVGPASSIWTNLVESTSTPPSDVHFTLYMPSMEHDQEPVECLSIRHLGTRLEVCYHTDLRCDSGRWLGSAYHRLHLGVADCEFFRVWMGSGATLNPHLPALKSAWQSLKM